MLRSLFFPLLFSLTLLASLPAHAQIKVFSEDVTEPTTKAKKKSSQKKEGLQGDLNCIKINPFLLARGVAGLSYERILGEKFSVEANFGLTYRDFVFEYFNMAEDLEVNGLYLGDGVPNVKYGPALGGGLMWYPQENDEFTGVYLQALVNYRKYNFTNRADLVVRDPANGSTYSTVSRDMDLGYEFFDVALIFGEQDDFLGSSLIRNSYFGIGMRHKQHWTRNTELDPNNVNIDVVGKVAKWSPMFYAGYAFGIPF